MDSVLTSTNLTLFFPAALALLLTPGPVVLYIITRSVDQGRKAGFVSVAGLELGNFFYVVAAALGSATAPCFPIKFTFMASASVKTNTDGLQPRIVRCPASNEHRRKSAPSPKNKFIGCSWHPRCRVEIDVRPRNGWLKAKDEKSCSADSGMKVQPIALSPCFTAPVQLR